MDLKLGFITLYNLKLFIALLGLILASLLLNHILLNLKRSIGKLILKLEKKGVL